jgi:hypothetical protein
MEQLEASHVALRQEARSEREARAEAWVGGMFVLYFVAVCLPYYAVLVYGTYLLLIAVF